MRYLLDTSVLSHLVRDPHGSMARKLLAVGEARICTSIVVACELRFGARKKASAELSRRVEALLSSLEVLPLAPPVDRIYAEVRETLERKGRPIGGNDYLIAAHALAHECTIVSDNTGEFRRVPNLRVENWLRPRA